jgi:hypothetical protein
MAIRLVTAGVTDLRLPTPAAKPDFTAARTIAGQSGQVRGNWQAFFVRIPSSGFADNRVYNVLGFDQNALGTFTLGGDHRIRIGADSTGSATIAGAGRLRPWVSRRGLAVLAYGTAENDGAMTALPLMTRDPDVYLVVEGIRNVGTAGSPDWRGFAAICPVGGAAASEVRASVNAGALSGAGTILGQIFVSQDTSVARHTPPNLVLEHYGLVEGDFPWDTVNNRPHHDAIAALAAGSGAATLYDYAELATAQNAGTLPFANCDQGLGEVRLWYPLTDLTAGGLANLGTAGTNTLVVTNHNSGSGGLTDNAAIVPAHWLSGAAPPVITEPAVKFFGGRGTRAISIAGTHSGNVQRRWERMSDNAALAGLDWATVTTTGAAFTIADTLPVGGPYRLRVRDAADNALTATPLEDVLVGTVLVTHGQSGMELTFGSGSPVLGLNNLNLAVDAGAQGLLVKLQNQLGGSTATYVQPAITSARLIGGQTPAVRSGAVAAMNQWNAMNPGHPLCIVNMAINGTGMASWAANNDLTAEGGHASWHFLGDIGVAAGAGSGNESGVVETYAAALGRWADLHVMMWAPGMSSDQAVRASYAAGIDARWSANTTAPWLIIPVWRAHREASDTALAVVKREEHVLFVNELGERGFLGPTWGDSIADNPGSLHAAYSATGLDAQPVLDTNQVGVTRNGRGIGRAAARVFDASINTQFRIVGAWWPAAAGGNTIEVELGRPARTLAGAAVRADVFWVSEDNGATWTNSGFTAALAGGATRVVLTKASGNWAASGVRVDYMRNFPNPPSVTANEANTEPLLNGLLYDAGTWRGRVDLATPAGNVLQGTNRVGAGVAGIPVEARGAARLLTTERFAGSRNVTVRMMAADGVTVLAEKELAVTAAGGV